MIFLLKTIDLHLPLIVAPGVPGLLMTMVCFPPTIWPGLANVTMLLPPIVLTILGLCPLAPATVAAPGAFTNLTMVAPWGIAVLVPRIQNYELNWVENKIKIFFFTKLGPFSIKAIFL